MQRIAVRGWGGQFPLLLYKTNFEAAQGGTYGFLKNESTGYVCYEELNEFGFFYHREDMVTTERDEDGKESHHAFLHSILTRLDLFIECVSKFYGELGYWGMLEIRIVLSKLEDVGIRDLPPPKGYYRIDQVIASPIDNQVEFSKIIEPRSFEQRASFISEIFPEIAWALGFSHITSVDVKKLLDESGRG